MSRKRDRAGHDPEKRRLKRQRQRAEGYQRDSGGAGAQMTHASSGRAKKKASEGERAMRPTEET